MGPIPNTQRRHLLISRCNIHYTDHLLTSRTSTSDIFYLLFKFNFSLEPWKMVPIMISKIMTHLQFKRSKQKKKAERVISDLEQKMPGRGWGPSGRSRSRMWDSSCRPRMGCLLPLSGWNTWMIKKKKKMQEIETHISLQLLQINIYPFFLNTPTNNIWFSGRDLKKANFNYLALKLLRVRTCLSLLFYNWYFDII